LQRIFQILDFARKVEDEDIVLKRKKHCRKAKLSEFGAIPQIARGKINPRANGLIPTCDPKIQDRLQGLLPMDTLHGIHCPRK
jgi:hypothetical protein